MKHKTKLISLIVVLLSALMIAGCGDISEQTTPSDSLGTAQNGNENILTSDANILSLSNVYGDAPDIPPAGMIKMTQMASYLIENYPENEQYFIIGVTTGENPVIAAETYQEAKQYAVSKLQSHDYLKLCAEKGCDPEQYSWGTLDQLLKSCEIEEALNNAEYQEISSLYFDYYLSMKKAQAEYIMNHMDPSAVSPFAEYLKENGIDVDFCPYTQSWIESLLIIPETSSRIRMINGCMTYLVRASGTEMKEIITQSGKDGKFGCIIYAADDEGKYIFTSGCRVSAMNILSDLSYIDRKATGQYVRYLD